MGNPILDELAGLSPGAQQALMGAHAASTITPPQPPPVDPGLQAPSKIQKPAQIGAPPPAPTATMSGPPPSMGAPSMPNVPAPRGTLAGDTNARGALEASPAGITQIHSRIENAMPNHPTLGKVLGYGAEIPARALEAAGSLLAPGRQIESMIPGTQIHRQQELNNLNTTIGKESQENLQGAQTGEANARTGLTTAQAAAVPEHEADTHALVQPTIEHLGAETEALKNPKDKTAFAAWEKQNPGASVEDWLKLQSENKPTPKENDFEQYYKDYLADQGLKDSAHARLVAREKYAAAGQTPQRAPIINMVIPGQNGAPDTLQAMHSGQEVPKGATTPGGTSSIAVNETKATAAQEKAAADAQKTYRLAQTLAANPSPTNDLALLMQYIGATKPESLGKLRLNQNEVSLVLGTRSSFGDLEALGQKIQNGQKLTPTQRQDMLGTMKIIAGEQGGAPEGADNEVYVGGNLVGHTVKGKYVPLAK